MSAYRESEMRRVGGKNPLKPGDTFIGYGPGWTIEAIRYTGDLGFGGNAERSLYAVTLRGPEGAVRVLPINAESRLKVIPA